MFLVAKLSPPRPDYPALQAFAFARILDHPITYFIAPEGYLLPDSLCAVLQEQGLPVCWVRLGLENCDPGALLLYLISAVQQAVPQAEMTTYTRMRSQPGPVAGWRMLFGQLANDLARAFPNGGILVLEGLESFASAPGVLHSLSISFLASLPPKIHCVLISTSRLPHFELPQAAYVVDFNTLRLDEAAGLRLLSQNSVGLSQESICRAITLTGGRAAALAGLIEVGQHLGAEFVHQEVKQAANMNDLLARFAKASLYEANENAMQSLGLCMRLKYSPPQRVHPGILESGPADGPWMQPLLGGWKHMRDLWNRPLQAALRSWATPSPRAMQLAATNLAGQNAQIEAINLFFAIGDPAGAAGLINEIADTLMDLGLWATLKAWLNRLPEDILHQWPWLIFISGKLAAAQGYNESARRSFAAATDLFRQRGEVKGACLSLLAESALAAWRSDTVFASERALTAHQTAQNTGLSLVQIWSAWQLGSLAASSGNMEEALGWFAPAGAAAEAGLHSIGEVLHMAENLIRRQQELLRQRTFLQQAFQEIDEAEKDVSARLRNLIYSTPENLDHLLDVHGWTHTPLLPISSAQVGGMPGGKIHGQPPGILRSLIDALGLIPTAEEPAAGLPGKNAADLLDVPELPLPLAGLENQPCSEKDDNQPQTPTAIGSGELKMPVPHEVDLDEPGIAEPKKKVDLYVCLLGTFNLVVGNSPVAEWSNNKSRALFKYLVFHRDQLTPKEILMENFWPGAPPESARNNLNVALHSIRSALAVQNRHATIVYQNGAYRLNPNLEVWLDTEEFKKHVQAGHQLETSGQVDLGMKEYEEAVQLYQADFLFDEPYEEWALPIRERLRVLYLDTLDHLSLIHFTNGDFNGCIALCQRMLECDNCREDAHSRLMRCYNRLGQDHLALRQYRICVEILRTELDLNPAPATTRLYEHIRSRGNA
jgi:DNA-binding SARP family transcriptional activator